jgi:hypothetical protein
MALLPDPPFPKARGDSIRSKDWNDTVVEVQRLDTAKVNRAGDTIGGPLTVTGNLGVGGAPADAEGLDRVLDLQAPTSAKLTVRTAAIDTRVLAHQGGFWGAPAGMVIGTRTAHPLSFGTNAAGRLTIDSAGLVGIGTQPQARLHVAGGQGDPSATEGDLKVGDANFRLKIGVTTSGSGAGDVRIRAHGGTNRLLLGGGTSDTLTVQDGGVGIGAAPGTARLHVSGGRLRVTDTTGSVLELSNGTKANFVFTETGTGHLHLRTDSATHHLLLQTSGTQGNVGIGTTPNDKLDVAGNLRILSATNPLQFNAQHSGFPNTATNRAEISNDTGTFKSLMILGNRSAGLSGPGIGRRVSVWDILEVNGTLRVTDFDIFLRAGVDVNHGLGWYGPITGSPYPKSFGGFAFDGPILYGFGGGGLGTTSGGQRVALSWNSAGNITMRAPASSNPISALSIDVQSFNTPANAAASYFFRVLDLGAGFTPFIIRGNGNVGIGGATVPQATLHVNGGAIKPGGGSWGTTSDRRLKKHVKPLKGILDRLLQLRGVSFEWRKPEEQGNLTGTQLGLVAQEVEEVFPEWVDTTPDGVKILTVRGFEAVTIEALRELRAEVEALQKQNEALEARVKALEGKPDARPARARSGGRSRTETAE